ncbi:MAG TPA: hypothetical protein VLY24_12100 [Bryobacteraceae bacterium]|nr:hypothetical protein [Bryobacteraceae bacterium]
MKKPFALAIWGLGVLLLCLSAPARADLSPGGSDSTVSHTFNLSGLTLLASGSASGSAGGTFGTVDWTLTDAVFADSNNVYGAGDLDFMYQIAFTDVAFSEPGAVSTVGVSSFAGFSTDAGYTASGGSLPGGVFGDGSISGSYPPLQDSRSADGAAVTFSWSDNSADNLTYNVVIVETNATLYDGNGVANVTANAVDPTATIFEPVAATVPEPGMFAPLAGGLMLLAVSALRRRRV